MMSNDSFKQKQEGMVSTFVTMMILTLMLIGAFILVNYLNQLYQSTSEANKKETLLHNASIGMELAYQYINQNQQLINKATIDKPFYQQIIEKTDASNQIKIEIKSINQNGLSFLAVQSTAHSNELQLSKTVYAEFFYHRNTQPINQQIPNGRYALIPGSWRDF